MAKKKIRRPNNNVNMRGKQGRKDSGDPRVNYDNARRNKVERDLERMECETRKTDKSNDVAWYANNPELLRAAASLPFSTYAGQPFPYAQSTSVPGVCALTWSPVVDAGYDAPINQAANSIYSFTVHANSRNQSYDAVDEMLLILAGSQVFAGLALGVRAYGLMRNYSQLDKYTPAALLQASGFDADDLQKNYSKMWFDLNELIARSQQIWIPNTMPVTQRWFWMNSNVYRDAAGAKAQYYIFTPDLFYKYDESGSSAGGQLVPVQWFNATTPNTWNQYMELMRGMISALIDSQDRGIIFGDILKAYGADKLYAMASMPVDYTTTPVYDTEVLTQIENATIYGFNKPSNIVQNPDSNILEQQWTTYAIPTNVAPWNAAIGKYGLGRTVLNMHTPEFPTPAQIMVATRLKTQGLRVLSKPTANTMIIVPDAVGTEVVTSARIYYYNYNQSPASLANVQLTYSSLTGILGTMVSACDWCPWFYFVPDETTLPSFEVGNVIERPWNATLGDFDQFTYVNTVDLKEMHRTAVYSEFGVPVII